MNVLSYGKPFFVGQTPLDLYGGPHEVRSLGGHPELPGDCDYMHDAAHDSMADILERMQPWRPDLMLCWFPEDFPPPIGIEDAPVPTLATASDWNLHYAKLATNLARYDVVLSDVPGVDILDSEWVSPEHPFPLYSPCTSIHHPYPVEKELDVVFVGGFNHFVRPERAHFLERLAKLSDRYRIVIATGYEGEAYGRMLSSARIVFNHGVRGEVNLRVFETLACGSVAFLEEGNAGAARWFENGRDIVLYNAGNFEERLAYCLEHPEETEAIAARGGARAAEFAGENRLTELIDYAAAHPSSGRRFRELPSLEQDYQTLAMLQFSFLAACQAREKRLMRRLVVEHPEDPRAWTAMGTYMMNPHLKVNDEFRQAELFVKAFLKALELDPASAPRAINAAWACRLCRFEDEEVRCLEAALDAYSLDGASAVVGDYSCRFWLRWRMALAKKTASLAMLHAEAHLRLAAVDGRHGRHSAAEAHVAQAAELDPDNLNGVELLAEAKWATGRQTEAAQTLLRYLPQHPFKLNYRTRLCEMLLRLGRVEESDVLTKETERVFKSCVVGPDAPEM